MFVSLAPVARWSLVLILVVGCAGNQSPTVKIWSTQDRNFLIDGLTGTRDSVRLFTQSLSEEQWNYRQDSTQWCIGEVVTHLALHDALFYREVRTLTALPPPPPVADSLVDQDHYLMEYAQITGANSGSAPWYLDPGDQWCQPQQASNTFLQTRNHYVAFVEQTDANLRSYFSPNGRGRSDYRDLHQLIMISIAHNRRHLQQIHNILEAADFPK